MQKLHYKRLADSLFSKQSDLSVGGLDKKDNCSQQVFRHAHFSHPIYNKSCIVDAGITFVNSNLIKATI